MKRGNKTCLIPFRVEPIVREALELYCSRIGRTKSFVISDIIEILVSEEIEEIEQMEERKK